MIPCPCFGRLEMRPKCTTRLNPAKYAKKEKVGDNDCAIHLEIRNRTPSHMVLSFFFLLSFIRIGLPEAVPHDRPVDHSLILREPQNKSRTACECTNMLAHRVHSIVDPVGVVWPVRSSNMILHATQIHLERRNKETDPTSRNMTGKD